MLIDYINAAMQRAEYQILEDGTYFGEVPPCQGVYSNADSLAKCQQELSEVLQDWLVLGLRAGDAIPIIDGIDLNYSNQPASEVA